MFLPPANGDLNSHPDHLSDCFVLLTLELVRNVSRGTDNLPANFDVSVRDISLSSYRQTRVKMTTCRYNLDL